MKRLIVSVITSIVTITLTQTVYAQKFETDPLFRDSVRAIQVIAEDEGWETASPRNEIYLPKGYTFEMSGSDNGSVIFQENGRYYKVSQGDIIFSRDNDKDTVNPLDRKHVRRHSFLGHFFAGPVPYLMIAVLILGGTLLGLAGQRNPSLRKTALKVLPISLGAGAIMEILAYWTLGSDITWWCDKDRIGFWMSLLAAIPFVAVVAAQYYSIRIYNSLIFPDREDGENTGNARKISIRPIAAAIISFFPVLVIMMLAFTKIFKWEGTVPDLISLITAVAVSALLIKRGYTKNAGCLGKQKGLMVTVFSTVYLLGLIISGFLAIIVIFKIILQIIIVAAVIFGTIYLMSVSEKYEPSRTTVYHAKDGSKHEHSADAERRNQEIDRRRNN